MILAIDPGNTHSGWCEIDDNYNVINKGKHLNTTIIDLIGMQGNNTDVVIEMVASYGMAVGQTVFDTCVWIGRFMQCNPKKSSTLFRKDVKMNICGQTRAKDSNIRQALIDRFSYERHKAKGGKGTKKDPGFFYGFKSDIWAAYALGVTYLDITKKESLR